MSIDRSGPGRRRSAEDLREGDIVHVDDIYSEYGVVVSDDPGARILFVRSGLAAIARSIPAYQVIDVDDILGVDSAEATHLLDRDAGEVIVMRRAEDGSAHYEERRFDVSPDQLGEYLVWLENEHDREWLEYSLRPFALEALREYRAASGGASA